MLKQDILVVIFSYNSLNINTARYSVLLHWTNGTSKVTEFKNKIYMSIEYMTIYK